MEAKSSQVVDFAVEMETKLHSFYVAASQKSRFRRIQDMFMSMAERKAANKELLESIPVVNIGPGFDLEDFALFRNLEISPGMSYREIRNSSLQLEENAFILYRNLAESDQEENVKATLLSLAEGAKQHLKIFQDQAFGK